MSKYTIYQVDAFTTEVFKGNPAGVVLGAETLTDGQMQAVARELNNSETAFILPPDDTNHEIRVRFFTPTTEVPSCGHATIAANYVWAIENNLDDTVVRQKIQIGILCTEIRRMNENHRYEIYMNQNEPEFLNNIEGTEKNEFLKALGVNDTDLVSNVPLQVVSTGHSKVMVPLNYQYKLNSLDPDMGRLKELSSRIKCNGYFVFTLDSDEPKILTHARMFAPAIGIPEDPVTGNGNGPMGAYLVRYDLARHNGEKFRFTSKQGEVMKREGLAKVEVQIDAGQPVGVKVGGEATVVFKTKINLNNQLSEYWKN